MIFFFYKYNSMPLEEKISNFSHKSSVFFFSLFLHISLVSERNLIVEWNKRSHICACCEPGRNVLSIQLKGRLSFRALIGRFSRPGLFPAQNCSFGKTHIWRVGMIDIHHPRNKNSLIEVQKSWKLQTEVCEEYFFFMRKYLKRMLFTSQLFIIFIQIWIMKKNSQN